MPRYDRDVRHPWERFIKALSVGKNYRGVEVFFNRLGTGETLSKEIYEGLKIPYAESRKGLDKQDYRRHRIAAWFTDMITGAQEIFADKEAREFVYILFLLDLSDKDVAVELPKKYPIVCTEDDIKLFRHYYWCVEEMARFEIQAFSETFSEPWLTYARRIFEKGEEAAIRKELGLALNIRDIDMLRTIRDSMYLTVMGGLESGKGVSGLNKSIKALTDVMSAALEVEQNMLSDEEQRPLYRPSFEEATALTSLESMIEQGEEIIGSEERAEVPDESED